MTKYLRSDLNSEVISWINTNLKNYLAKGNMENQTDIEHIIDYLSSSQAPKRLKKMSYEEAYKGAVKWNKTLIKKAGDIVETKLDVNEIIVWKSGMRLVQLKGESAFNREGKLMSHCVKSYYGKKECEIYSLRDSKNMPHCTFEIRRGKDRRVEQIKGKGNGSIHPKYIKYVLKCLDKFNVDVNSYEMKHLGYIELNSALWASLDSGYSKVKSLTYKNNRYFYVHSKIEKNKG